MFDVDLQISDVDPRAVDGHACRAAAPGRPCGVDRLGELCEPAGDAGARLRADQQVRRRVIPPSATTVVASMWTWPSNWRSTGPSSSSAPAMPTCSRTAARRPMPAVYMAMLQPGDTILGMSLAHGGHLTHGASVNFSGKLYKSVSYGLEPETELLDYAQVAELAAEHKPKMIVAGASAYSRVIDWQRLRDIADRVDAYLLVDMAHYAGLVAAGEYPNPVGIAPLRHQHHPQDPARAAWRADPEPAGVREAAQFDDLPGHPGRAVDACDRGQGPGLQGGHVTRLQGLPAAGQEERPGHGPDTHRAGPAHRLRRHRQPCVPAGPAGQEDHRQGGRGRAGPGPSHGQQERHPQ